MEDMEREVWARVTGQREQAVSAAAEKELHRLTAFLQRAAQTAEKYRELAAKSRSRQTAAFWRSLAREERENLQKLQTARFLFAGDTAAITVEKTRPEPVLQAVRAAWMTERDGVMACLAAAADCSEEHLRIVYLQLSETEKRHAHRLQKLVEQMVREGG